MSAEPPLASRGHRKRLRARFRERGRESVADHELIELLLFRAMPRRDVEPLAKALLKKFGSFAETIAAPSRRLAEAEGMSSGAITEFKIVEAAAQRLLKGRIEKRRSMRSGFEVVEYCRSTMAFADKEVFRILFLDKRNALIADESQGAGTVDQMPVYPREVVKRALELAASAVILVHNHPSGDPTPSTHDVEVTRDIVAAARLLGVSVHDHIIVGRHGHASLRGLQLI